MDYRDEQQLTFERRDRGVVLVTINHPDGRCHGLRSRQSGRCGSTQQSGHYRSNSAGGETLGSLIVRGL
jgi:hypothetical protein